MNQNLLNSILQSGGGQVVAQLGQQFGLGESQVSSALGQLVPAVSQGFKSNATQEGGLESLLAALQNGNHERYVDEPAQLGATETTTDGNAILGHLFGSKDVSRNVAARASEQTGISSSLLKQLLPVVASLAMGAMAKQRGGGGALAALAGAVAGGTASGGLGNLMGLASSLLGGNSSNAVAQNDSPLGALAGFLDSDGDGSVADDILQMIARKAA